MLTNTISCINALIRHETGIEIKLGSHNLFINKQSDYFDIWDNFISSAELIQQLIYAEWNTKNEIQRILPVKKERVIGIEDRTDLICVRLRISPAAHYLEKSNPNFSRIYETIINAMRRDRALLVVAHDFKIIEAL